MTSRYWKHFPPNLWVYCDKKRSVGVVKLYGGQYLADNARTRGKPSEPFDTLEAARDWVAANVEVT